MSMQDRRSVEHTMLLHAEGGGEGGANRRMSPTGARSLSCPHTPLAERQPKKQERSGRGGEREKKNGQ